MICKNCHREIDDGSIFCIHCQTPTELTPRVSLLEEGEVPVVEKAPKKIQKEPEKENPSNKKKKKSKAKIYTAISIVIIVIMAGIFIYLNSYSNIINKAKSEEKNGNYEAAIEYYMKAYEKKSDVTALVAIGRNYYMLEDYDKSEDYYFKVLSEDSENTDAFTGILDLYFATDNVEGLDEAYSLASNDKMKGLYNEYMTKRPVFSVVGGSYTEDISLELSSQGGLPVYYTINGDNPKDGKAKLYDEPIELGEGSTTVRAVCLGDGGYGVEVSQEYNIKYEIPPYPTVNPYGGTFTEPTSITISSTVENASIYYTWDGSTPTAKSQKYGGPIPMEEGNNILSIIVISENGQISEVLQCNYIYYSAGEE